MQAEQSMQEAHGRCGRPPGRGRWRGWQAFALLLAAGASHAELRVSERTVHYDLAARSLDALRDEIRRNGPQDESGRRYDGLTAWTIEWAAEFRDDELPGRPRAGPRRCRPDGHAVTLDLTVTVPRWAHRDRAGREARERWDAYLAALVAHEAQHRALAVDGARRIEAALAATAPGERCRDLQWQVEKVVNRIQQRLGVDNRLLDRRTKHGREQGVRL
ncbi:DUF922 domain-containing protein [Cognatilysobacter tabacisoli]|uniref:DUF922 domain-containing protein n=1 Tax=Cognatilysobacter tabacisoli TaxID=2315424 RepID=UPI000E6B4B2F|nr:DUF922 domain-containing protein [Lysobacter tabacisoli]